MSVVVRNNLWLAGIAWVFYLNGYRFVACGVFLLGALYLGFCLRAYQFKRMAGSFVLVSSLVLFLSGLSGLAIFKGLGYFFLLSMSLNVAVFNELLSQRRVRDLESFLLILGGLFVIFSLSSFLFGSLAFSIRYFTLCTVEMFIPFIAVLYLSYLRMPRNVSVSKFNIEV